MLLDFNSVFIVYAFIEPSHMSEAIMLMELAWKEMPESILKNAWNRLLNWDDSEYEPEDDLPLSQLLTVNQEFENAAQNTQVLLSQILPTCPVTIEEISEWNDDIQVENLSDEENEEESSNESMEEDVLEQVGYDEAIASVNKLIGWCNTNQSAKHITNLLGLRADIVAKHLKTPMVQKRVTDFFTRRDVPNAEN